MTFAESLQWLLDERHLKQADLCRMTNIASSVMSNYVNGQISPTIGSAILIADALKVSLDRLAGREEPDTSICHELHAVASELPRSDQLLLADIGKAIKAHRTETEE